MPAERAITSSYLRLSETSVAIAANRATKGTVCSMIIGTRSAETASASSNGEAGQAATSGSRTR